VKAGGTSPTVYELGPLLLERDSTLTRSVMAAICPHCNSTLDIFKDRVFQERCQYCDSLLSETPEETQRSRSREEFRSTWIYPFLGLVSTAILRAYRVDWFYILLAIPMIIVALVFLSSIWQWFRNKDKPGGISIK